jgi:hypothetical protein
MCFNSNEFVNDEMGRQTFRNETTPEVVIIASYV